EKSAGCQPRVLRTRRVRGVRLSRVPAVLRRARGHERGPCARARPFAKPSPLLAVVASPWRRASARLGAAPMVIARPLPLPVPELEPRSAPVPLARFARINEVLRHERPPSDLEETRAVLLELARRKSGRLPAEWLVEQTLRVSE